MHSGAHWSGFVRNYAQIVVAGQEPRSCAIAHDFGHGNPPKGVVSETLARTGVALKLHKFRWAT